LFFSVAVQHKEERRITRTGTRRARQSVDAQKENARRVGQRGRNGRRGRIYE